MEYIVKSDFSTNQFESSNKRYDRIKSKPAYVLVVDVSGDEAFCESIKSSLLATLEALPPSSLIGLCTFSDRIGLYDLRSDIPHILYTQIPSDGKAPSAVPLSEVFPIDSFLVNLAENKNNIASAIESISTSFSRKNSIKNHNCEKNPENCNLNKFCKDSALSEKPSNNAKNKKSPTPPRGFGSVVSSLISYLTADERFRIFARILNFISGCPNFGMGICDEDRFRLDDSKSIDSKLLNDYTDFYCKQALIASHSAICFDLYVVSNLKYSDLTSIRYLSLMTGGNLLLYETVEDASLPQDLYRQLKQNHAFDCIVRFRTSPEFHVSSVYGHLVADEQISDMFRIAGCDQSKIFSLNFDFESSRGFSDLTKSPYQDDDRPMLQMAFAFTEKCDNIDENGKIEIVPVRKLKVMTCQLSVARSFSRLYKSASSDIIISHLTNQMILLSQKHGILKSREALQE